MKKIIIPVDFCPASKNTCRYAWEFIRDLGPVELSMVHCFMPALEGEYPNIVPPVNEVIASEEAQLHQFVEELQAEGMMVPGADVAVKEVFLIDNPVSGITKLSAAHDLILMGTKGRDSLLDDLIGTKASIVSKKAKCPILVLPMEARYTGIKHILYATNEESADDEALEVIQELNKRFKATIHFVHVRNKAGSRFAHIQTELVDELLEEEEPEFAFEIEEISGTSVTDSLLQYCQDHPIDMMVVASKHRGFWEAFFHQSESRKLAKFTTKPLLIYHFD